MQHGTMIIGAGDSVKLRIDWVEQQGVHCIGAHWEKHDVLLHNPLFLLEKCNPSVIFILWPLGSESTFRSSRKLIAQIYESVTKRGLKHFPLIALMSDHPAVKAEAEFLGVRTHSDDGAGFTSILEEAKLLLPEAESGPQILIPHT
jgi:hypothetical protein